MVRQTRAKRLAATPCDARLKIHWSCLLMVRAWGLLSRRLIALYAKQVCLLHAQQV